MTLLDYAEEGYLPVSLAALLVGCPHRTLRTWARRGQVPSMLADGRLLIHVDDTVRHAQLRNAHKGD